MLQPWHVRWWQVLYRPKGSPHGPTFFGPSFRTREEAEEAARRLEAAGGVEKAWASYYYPRGPGGD